MKKKKLDKSSPFPQVTTHAETQNRQLGVRVAYLGTDKTYRHLYDFSFV